MICYDRDKFYGAVMFFLLSLLSKLAISYKKYQRMPLLVINRKKTFKSKYECRVNKNQNIKYQPSYNDAQQFMTDLSYSTSVTTLYGLLSELYSVHSLNICFIRLKIYICILVAVIFTSESKRISKFIRFFDTIGSVSKKTLFFSFNLEKKNFSVWNRKKTKSQILKKT